LVIGLKRLGVQVADVVGLGIKVLIVAIEPVLTLVRLEIDLVQDAPDTGAADAAVLRASRKAVTISASVHLVTVRLWSCGKALATEMT
jgi:hypothetical protein